MKFRADVVDRVTAGPGLGKEETATVSVGGVKGRGEGTPEPKNLSGRVCGSAVVSDVYVLALQETWFDS